MSSPISFTLDDDALRALDRKAQAIGVPTDQLARMLVEHMLFNQAYADSRVSVAEPPELYNDEGPARSWDEVRPELEALIERTFGPD